MSAIDDKYTQLGGSQGFLGQPTSSELITPNGLGSYRHYQGGSIYWNHALPVAFEVHGLIREKWASLGWENSFLGFPKTDEHDVAGGRGRSNTFEHGAIAWTPATGAHEIHGEIFGRWSGSNREDGLGFPLTDELSTPGNRGGRYNHFENGSIYWTSQTGAHEVRDFIKNTWAAAGWEQGPLGYPVSAPGHLPGSITMFQDFEHGTLYDYMGMSRTVIRSNSVVAVSGYTIGWNSFGVLMPDMDRISVSFSSHSPNGNVQLTLNSGPGITWWKGVSLWSPTSGDIIETWTLDNHKSNTISISPSSLEPGNICLLFKKAKIFGIHTGMYWLGRADRLLGNNVSFTWLQDH
jgi:uncharacterized protein with LGFP repeats